MKIVILGSNGYVGSSLCKLYQYNQKDEIIAIDSKFIPEHVEWLVNHNFKFYQRDIFNTADLLKDADIVYNLVSITEVPKTIEEETKEKAEIIYKVGVDGNRYVMDNISDKTRLLFLSSHILFEGIKDSTFDINEIHDPRPVFSYGRSKEQSEFDLINSSKNYVIARLGSVYGAGNNMRIGIVANIFAKMTAMNQKIKITGANSYKPSVGIYDVCRAIRFLAEGDYGREIFHIVNENIQVKDIAEICKQNNPNLEIEVVDKCENLGYTLSNSKILETGFKFEQNIQSEIKYMINKWKNR